MCDNFFYYEQQITRDLKGIHICGCRCNERQLFYYEQPIKRELKRIHIRGCRFNERLKVKTDGSKLLVYTGFRGDLEHLTMETRLLSESFESVMGECVI